MIVRKSGGDVSFVVGDGDQQHYRIVLPRKEVQALVDYLHNVSELRLKHREGNPDDDYSLLG